MKLSLRYAIKTGALVKNLFKTGGNRKNKLLGVIELTPDISAKPWANSDS